jgi:hypothetical protein
LLGRSFNVVETSDRWGGRGCRNHYLLQEVLQGASDLLEKLQPLIDDVGRQTLLNNLRNVFTSGNVVGAWLGKLKDMLEDEKTKVNKCIKQ